jgi:hypothetical protein
MPIRSRSKTTLENWMGENSAALCTRFFVFGNRRPCRLVFGRASRVPHYGALEQPSQKKAGACSAKRRIRLASV